MKHAIALLLISFALHAEEPVRQVAAKGDLHLLTEAQQKWLAGFESSTGDFDRQASGAREAGLALTADYLAVCARVTRGEATIEDAERAFRRTLDEPLIVIVRFDGQSVADIVVCTCDPARTRALEHMIEKFQRPHKDAITRIANLHFRSGKNAASASTGTYLPFDRALTPAVGRTWIVYDNMIRANWWGEGVRPVALRLFPSDSGKATAEAMVEWYGSRLPMYDVGPSVDRTRLGAAKDPIAIIKGDVLPVVLHDIGDEYIATLAAVSFYTLRDFLHGEAPPAHRPASTAEINWLIEHGALRFDEASVTWTIDFPRARSAIRELSEEILAIDASGDAARAEALLAKYGNATAAIDKSLATIDTLARVKVQPVFVR